MNEDIPIYSIVLLKIVAVVQVTFGLTLILVGSFFLFIMMTNDVFWQRILSLASSGGFVSLYFYLYLFLKVCIGLFMVYAGVQSLRARLSGFNWNLSCMLLIVCGGFITYNIWTAAPPPSSGITTQAAFSPILYYQCLSAALSGMVGGILSGKYEKYQLRESLKTPSKTQ